MQTTSTALWQVTVVVNGEARPTFYLHPDVQGILSTDTAIKVALDVMGIAHNGMVPVESAGLVSIVVWNEDRNVYRSWTSERCDFHPEHVLNNHSCPCFTGEYEDEGTTANPNPEGTSIVDGERICNAPREHAGETLVCILDPGHRRSHQTARGHFWSTVNVSSTVTHTIGGAHTLSAHSHTIAAPEAL